MRNIGTGKERAREPDCLPPVLVVQLPVSSIVIRPHSSTTQ